MYVRLPRWLARFNRIGTNKVMGLWAPYLPPWAVVAHHGRRSGKPYRTVIFAFRRGQSMVIALTYGETDWERNVLAAGSAEITRLGRAVHIVEPRLVAARNARELPVGTRWTARVFGLALAADVADNDDPRPQWRPS